MWIGKRFKKFVFYCPDGTKWKVGKKISEKDIESHPDLYERGLDTSEAQAVYHCRQIKGPSEGLEAILKIRMQIPEPEFTSHDLLSRARQASDVYGVGMSQEIHALKWFTERGCPVTPRLLHLIEASQDDPRFPVPGGWLVFLLMERVPGVPLTDFWNYDFAKRETIRRAFGKSLAEFYNQGGYQMDCSLENLIYDENQEKCYFIDFEDAGIELNEQSSTICPVLLECELRAWNLAEEKSRHEQLMEEYMSVLMD